MVTQGRNCLYSKSLRGIQSHCFTLSARCSMTTRRLRRRWVFTEVSHLLQEKSGINTFRSIWFHWRLPTVSWHVPVAANAQYTACDQTYIISSVTSFWRGTYRDRSNTLADVLLVESNNVLSSPAFYLGHAFSSSNNSDFVPGLESVWNDVYLRIGRKRTP